MSKKNIPYTVHFAQMALHILGRKPAPKPKVKTTKKAESRSILINTNDRFFGILEFPKG